MASGCSEILEGDWRYQIVRDIRQAIASNGDLPTLGVFSVAALEAILSCG